MANGNPDPLLEKAKFFREHVQSVLSLATGAFVLSVTFLHDIAQKAEHNVVMPAQHVEFLKKSWGLFAVAILLGLIYNYVLSIYVRVAGKSFGGLLSGISFVFHAAFVAAVYYMWRFGTANL